VKILKSIELAELTEPITIENYHLLFRAPEPWHKKHGLVKSVLLELTELG